MDCLLFPDINHLTMLVCLIYILKVLLKIKRFAIISSQWESLLRPYQHDLMVRKGGGPVVMHGWFVCPTVSILTTSHMHATGLEKI